MSPNGLNLVSSFPVPSITFPDFEICWAGEELWYGGLLLGSDDGRLRRISDDLQVIGPTFSAAPSGEAINGVAFAGSMIAVSTRADVTYIDYGLRREASASASAATYQGGAHGVVATPGGRFVAPLGPRGLLTAQLQDSGLKMSIASSKGRPQNLYRLALLASRGGGDHFACAARRDGLLVFTLDEQGSTSARSFARPGLDLVDVVAPGTARWPSAVIGLGADNTLHFCRDVFDGRPPRTLRPVEIKGVAYTLLTNGADLFLLTSFGLYTYPRLVEDLLGEESASLTRWHFSKMSAVDAFLSHGQLLVVLPERILSIPIETLPMIQASAADPTSSSIEPDWTATPAASWAVATSVA